MAATQLFFPSLLFSDKSSHQASSLFNIPMLSSFNCFLFLVFFIFILTLYIILKNISYSKKQENSIKIQSLTVNDYGIAARQQGNEMGCGAGRENPGNSLLLGIMPTNSEKWDTVSGESRDFHVEPDGEYVLVQEEKKRKKKKRAKNKTSDSNEEVGKEKDELVCFYPFTKSSSATQRKIKHQYDQLVKSHGSHGLTLDQIGQFINCLIEAKTELQHKSEVIKRKFTITKALLFKADRSSFDRLRQQIYKLELEQKRLEEDTFVYNWLQEQLKVSPAYQKMLEIGARVDIKAKSACLVESTDTDISFEELLAQEKKDGFWQRNGRLKPCQDEPNAKYIQVSHNKMYMQNPK